MQFSPSGVARNSFFDTKLHMHRFFLSRVSILTHDIDIANLSVRPSVRLSVMHRYENSVTYRHMQFFSP